MIRTKKQKTIVIKRSQRCVSRYKKKEDRRETIKQKFQRNMRHIRKLSNFDYVNAFLIILEIFSCDCFYLRELNDH